MTRRVVLGMQVSVDGFLSGPDGDLSWIEERMDQELLDDQELFLRSFDTMFLGRGAYLEQVQYWPTAEGPLADLLNGFEKVVFSSTLEEVDAWPHARLAVGSPADEVAGLRAGPGADIFVSGGARLAHAMLARSVIDEVRLIVQPIAIGSGIPVFEAAQPLELITSKPLRSGALVTTYGVVR